MLPKEKRLKSDSDFKRAYQKGAFFYQKYFNVNYLKNRGSFSRLGFVVGKKVANKAVLRNEVKRKFREISRELYAEAPKGYDIVINIKKEALKAEQSELKTEVQRALQKIGKDEKNSPRGN